MSHRFHHNVDVCVVGGGMAGLCAALAAARHGAKTVLVQDRPVLGGNASSEIRMWICGAHGKNLKETGILEEIQLDNCHQNPAGHYSIWDSVLWAKASHQPHLTLLLNCSCTGCEVDAQDDERRIASIDCWQLTSQTWHTIGAKVFIDCSGDSILAPASGAAFRMGREARDEFDEDIEPNAADEKTMGNTLLIQIRKTDQPQPFVTPRWAYKFDSPEDLPYRIKGVQGGNFWWIELGGLQHTIHDAESIRDDLMRAAWGVWDYIKNRAPQKDQADHWALEWLGSLPGKRENRRYEGLHVLTQNDVRAGGPFDDVIAYGGWSMDDHHPAGLLYPGKPTLFHPTPSPFGIPYRSLVSRNVTNLMCAGRNISVTHAALSSTRVMATCAIIGQAAGTGAAMATQLGISPAGVYPNRIAALQQKLMEDDCYLPGRSRATDPINQGAQLDGPLLDGNDRPIGEKAHAWVGQVGQSVTLELRDAVDVAAARIVFDSNLNNDKRMPCSYPQQADRSAVPDSMTQSFQLEARRDGQWQTVHQSDDNYQRLVVAPVGCRTDAIRLTPRGTWGADSVRLFGFEALATDPNRLPQLPQGPRWSAVVAAVEPKALAPPDSGLETAEPAKRHGA